MTDMGPRRLQILEMLRGSTPLSQLSPAIARRAQAAIPKTIGNIRIDIPAEKCCYCQACTSHLKPTIKVISNPRTLKHMKRELKPEEHEKIVNAVAAGDRIKALNIYL